MSLSKIKASSSTDDRAQMVRAFPFVILLAFFPNGVFDYAVNLSQKSYSKRKIARNAEIRARNADGIKKILRFRVFFVHFYQGDVVFVITVSYRSIFICLDFVYQMP